MTDEVRESDVQEELRRLADRVAFLEERCSTSRTVDHAGIAVVAGNAMEGGGTIEATRTLAFSMKHLPDGKPYPPDFLILWGKDGEYYRCSFMDFVDCLVKASWVPSRLEGLERVLRELQRKVATFSIYERLHQLESIVEVVECELQELKDRAESEDEAN